MADEVPTADKPVDVAAAASAPGEQPAEAATVDGAVAAAPAATATDSTAAADATVTATEAPVDAATPAGTDAAVAEADAEADAAAATAAAANRAQREAAALEARLPITVYSVTAGGCVVYDLDDAVALRRKLRVCVSPLGVDMAGLGPSLPVALMPEEVTYSLGRGWIRLASGTVSSHTAATAGGKRAREESSDGAAGKKVKLEDGSAAAAEPTAAPSTTGSGSGGDSDSGSTSDAVVWHYPQTTREHLRYTVYCDMVSRGFTVTSGAKFGGDFMAYAADPFFVHAQMIVTVMGWEEVLPLPDLVALARVASTTKKDTVAAAVNPTGGVEYSALRWMGPM